MVSLGSPQIQVSVDSVDDGDEQQQVREAQMPLLSTNKRRDGARLCLKRCCIKSKSALLILCWEILVTLTYGYAYESGLVFATDVHIQHRKLENYTSPLSYMSFFGFFALLYLFYPLAGCLADIRCGRYKTVLCSLWFITLSGTFICIISIVILSFHGLHTLHVPPEYRRITHFAIGLGTPAAIGIVLLLFPYISLSANVIQFGVDQLHDSPSEDSVLFINWFIFSSRLGVAINKMIISISKETNNQAIPQMAKLYLVPILALILLGASLGLTHYKRQWFMIDPGSKNPYKLVYKVIKFAAQHKNPIYRSAFTYCEDELPSRMDLAKEKYGGPFTTEQVEDVKAFLGILCILLTFGSVFTIEIAVSNILFKFSLHLNVNDKIYTRWYLRILLEDFLIGGLPETLTVILIPLYICVLRSFIHRYIPGMLRRIGLAMIIRLLSLLSVFIIDTIGHISTNNTTCFIFLDFYERLGISMWYVILPYVLNTISDLLFYIAAYEFICAQSPHAMKGLLIGTFFTVKGVFQLISVLVILVPFTTWRFDTSFPSCGFVYYLVNIVVALIGLVAYTWVARRYQYRQRDEPDNIYRYAEEYYDRDHEEHRQYNYDSSDYDNLNVYTIS